MDSVELEHRLATIERKLDAILAFLEGAASHQPTYSPEAGADMVPGAVPNSDPAMSADLLELIRRGKKIQAIKLYRERTNSGLKTAKDAIDDAARRMSW